MSGIGCLVQQQAQVFLLSFLAGAGLFTLYDLFRILRRVFSHELPAIAVEDILYWIVWTWSVFYLMNQINNGLIRGFTLGAIGAGMLAYYYVLSRWVILVGVWSLRKVVALITLILSVVLWPLRYLAKLFLPSGRYIKNKTAKSTRIVKKQLQNRLHTIRMGLCKL